MRWRSIVGWTAVATGALLLFVLAAGYLVLRSSRFHKYALAKIVDQVNQSTGGETQIEDYDVSLGRLSANIYGVQVRGKEGADQAPLLQVERIHAAVKIVSLIGGEFGISDIAVEQPVVHLYIGANGETNVPQPKMPKQSSSSFNVFKTTVDHARLKDGQIYVNDRKIPVEANVYGLDTNVDFNSAAQQYTGFIRYKNGQLQYARMPAFPHSLNFEFAATPSQFSATPLEVTIGGSRIVFRGDVTNYANPSIAGNYNVLLHGKDFGALLPAADVSGDVGVSGALRYQAAPNQELLQAVTLNGTVNSSIVRVGSEQALLDLRDLTGKFNLADGNLRVQGVSVDLLDGRLTADLNMEHLESAPVARVQASLQQISLAAAKASIRNNPNLRQVALTGTLGGTLNGSWKGSPKNIRMHSDLSLRSRVASSSTSGTPVPIDGDVHADYDGMRSTLTLQRTSLRSGATTITAQGTIGQRSALNIRARASQLNQLAALISQFRSGPSAAPMSVSGAASLDATVTGAVSEPNINAHLSTQNLVVQGTRWSMAQLGLNASPSRVSVQNGTLTNAERGRATFSATIGLRNWKYSERNPLQASISAQQLSIKQLGELTGKSLPITGELYLNATLDGSQLNPSGKGNLRLERATAYNEKLQNLAIQFNAANGTINSTLDVAIPAGSANAKLSFAPKTKSYQLALNTSSISLERLAALQAKNLALAGTVSASARGAGTLDDPKITASIDSSKIQFKQTTITGIKAALSVEHKKADISLRTDVSQASIQAKGSVNLSGEYETVATFDTSAFPLDPLLASYLRSIPEGFEGRTEMHASLRGPLKDKSRLEAHLVIPTLSAKYQALQIGNASPIKADYVHSVVTIQPAELRGTDTSLHFQGRIPITNVNAGSVAANGNINLQLVQIFAPDLRTSGNVLLDLRAGNGRGLSGVEGEVRFQKAAFSSVAAPVALDRLDGTLSVQRDHVQLSNLVAQVGGGQITLGGSITYRPSLQFNVAATGRSVRLRYPEGLRSVLDSNITLTGNMQQAVLAGRVLVDSMSFTQDFDLANFAGQFGGESVPSTGESFADRVKLNVAVQSAGSFQAVSSQVSLEGQANLQIIGAASNPVVVGRLDLTSGEIFFMKKRYELTRGIINFVNPARTDPVLNMLISTTVEQYNLSLGLLGPIDRLRVTYNSDPPLPPVDIISLVARGQTTEESVPGNFSANNFLAQQIGSEVGSNIGKLAGLSSLQIDPLLGSDNRNPSARVAVQQRVTKNLLLTFSTDVTNPQSEVIQGEYQINRRWSVSATRDESGGVAFDARYHTNF